jgi:hypothetical protein
MWPAAGRRRSPGHDTLGPTLAGSPGPPSEEPFRQPDITSGDETIFGIFTQAMLTVGD